MIRRPALGTCGYCLPVIFSNLVMDNSDWIDVGSSLNLPRVSRHTITAVYSKTPKDLISNEGRGKRSSKKPNSYREGLYILGGIDDNSNANSKIHLIDTGLNPWKKSVLETKGRIPEPRFDHCAHFMHSKSMLLIYGGCTRASGVNKCLGDACYLHLPTLSWCKIDILVPGTKIPRYDFVSAVYDDKLYVIGGVGENCYLDCKVDILDLDEHRSAKVALTAKSGDLGLNESGVLLAKNRSKTKSKSKNRFKLPNVRRDSKSYRPIPRDVVFHVLEKLSS